MRSVFKPSTRCCASARNWPFHKWPINAASATSRTSIICIDVVLACRPLSAETAPTHKLAAQCEPFIKALCQTKPVDSSSLSCSTPKPAPRATNHKVGCLNVQNLRWLHSGAHPLERSIRTDCPPPATHHGTHGIAARTPPIRLHPR